jgi:hypothetical protein
MEDMAYQRSRDLLVKIRNFQGHNCEKLRAYT